ncbi:MAG: hypothetical protein R3F62_07360 [Planctomycetota bacterium]
MQRSLLEGTRCACPGSTPQSEGLCPPGAGAVPFAVCRDTVTEVFTLSDPAIFAAQKHLIAAGWTVEPAGAAATALVLEGRLPDELLAGRAPRGPPAGGRDGLRRQRPRPARRDPGRARPGLIRARGGSAVEGPRRRRRF